MSDKVMTPSAASRIQSANAHGGDAGFVARAQRAAQGHVNAGGGAGARGGGAKAGGGGGGAKAQGGGGRKR